VTPHAPGLKTRPPGVGETRPPWVGRAIVTALVPAPTSEFLLGDLEEQFHRDCAAAGRLRARWRYTRRAWSASWRSKGTIARRSEPQRSRDMRNAWRDLRLGLRTAARSPGYSAITILTLALAIGANTLLFSIANPLIVRALPVKDPETLGWVSMINAAHNVTRGRASAADFHDLRASTSSFTVMAAYDTREMTMAGVGDAERIVACRATPSLVEVWGLTPVEGRLFQPGEDEPGRERVAVLSHRFWRERFNADRDAVGRRILLDGRSTTIVGVMRPEIELGNLAQIDAWVPLAIDPASPRDTRTLRAMGRLKPGSTVESANQEFRTLSASLAAQHATTNDGWSAAVVSSLDALASPETFVILGLLGVIVFFVLIIACVNLANLVLARTVARRHDFAVQAALGASRVQLIRPLLFESLLLSLAGGAAGLGLAHLGLKTINAAAYEEFLRTVSVDANVLVFAVSISFLTPVLFSLWPAWSAGRAPAAEAIRESRGSAGRSTGRRRSILIASQVALALSLLVVSGLVVQSMRHLRTLDVGLETDKLLTFRFELPESSFSEAGAQARFADELVRDLGALPNADGVAVLSHLPVFDWQVRRLLAGTHREAATEDDRPWASWYAVSPAFFRAAGMPLLAGRGFDATDREGSQPVAILSRRAAEQYFDSMAGAVGRTISVSGGGLEDRQVTVVGVAHGTPNTVDWTIIDPQIYVPFAQWPSRGMSVLVRSDAGVDPALVRGVMRRKDATVAVSNLKMLSQIMTEELSSAGILNALFSGFALLALALAAAGLYGVISYSVGQRRREFGVRLALGAAPSSIRRLVIGEGLQVVGVGAVIGLIMAAGLAYAARSLLFGISAADPATFMMVTAIVLIVGILAMWAPAVRAMRVDPVRTLRAD
jgi:putative ABC transport system permease protein